MAITILDDIEFDEAVTALKNKVPVSKKLFQTLPTQLRQHAFTVANLESINQIQAVLDSLEKSLKEGSTFSEWKKTLNVELTTNIESRLSTIYRTNMQAAFNEGSFQNMLDNKESRPFAMYDAINDGRTRPSHRALDGIIRPVDDSFWRKFRPPNGFNCRCSMISLTEEQAKKRSGNNKGLNKRKPRNGGADPGFEGDTRPTSNKVLLEEINKKLDKLPKKIRDAFKRSLDQAEVKAKNWHQANKQTFE